MNDDYPSYPSYPDYPSTKEERLVSDPNRSAEKAKRVAEKKARYDAYINGLEMQGITFQEFGKIARLNRDVVITEKIDGTNAAIRVVTEVLDFNGSACHVDGHVTHSVRVLDKPIVVAQSRTRILTTEQDNFGFAAWVEAHAETLARVLGPGLHFGEWWGSGIQRGYDLGGDRWFSLFNTDRWIVQDGRTYPCIPTEGVNPDGKYTHIGPDKIHPDLVAAQQVGIKVNVVPVLYRGPWTGVFGYKNSESGAWLSRIRGRASFRTYMIEWLKQVGSQAVPGYMKPEGIVVFHTASGTSFKVTVENDAKHKGEV